MTQQHQIPAPRLPDPFRQPKPARTWLWVLLGLAIAAVVSLLAMYWPVASEPPTTHTVVYEADGSGTNAGSFTLQTPTGSQQEKGGLPLKNQAGGTGLTFSGFHSGDFVYLSVQNENPTGVVTCRIVVDGSTVSENTSTGGYVIATCSGRVP